MSNEKNTQGSNQPKSMKEVIIRLLIGLAVIYLVSMVVDYFGESSTTNNSSAYEATLETAAYETTLETVAVENPAAAEQSTAGTESTKASEGASSAGTTSATTVTESTKASEGVSTVTATTAAETTTVAATTTTATTAVETTTTAAQEYVFRSKKLLEQHYEKHGKEMGFASAKEYEAAACAVINNSDALSKVEKEDGDLIYYIPETNEFVVLSTDGYIRTYFLPSAGMDYYNRQ